jgi:putative salt-induced outer membrane protein YdiY
VQFFPWTDGCVALPLTVLPALGGISYSPVNLGLAFLQLGLYFAALVLVFRRHSSNWFEAKVNIMCVVRILQSLAFCLVGLVWLSLPVMAGESEGAAPTLDQIVLKNGSIIMGTVTGSRDGVVTIDTDFAGTLDVALDQIATVQTQGPTTIQLADKTVISDQPLRIEAEQLLVSGDAIAQQSYAISELAVVNPEPWELGEGYKWSGLVSLALLMERGNTDTDELDYNMESVWRSTRDRYTLGASGENDENNGETNAEKWAARAKYDYFLDDPYYVGVQVFAEHDKFTDLDLRYLVGPFVGRQFYDEPIFTLSGELGVSYVDENFIDAEDQDYTSANWTIDASSNYLGGDSRLYFRNVTVWNLDETSDVIVNTSIGLAFPLLWGLEAAAEVFYEYDSGAVEQVDDLDETYKFRLGYTW